ncbi:MAG: tyrosine--tRNA ligase [Candidatus Omnitrophota bacterium]
MLSIEEQLKLIRRGTSEIISDDDLKNKLKKNRPLVIKAGFDPTAADIHLGHSVILRKLRLFQDLGHIVYFLIGDFTARIGDPSGKDKQRPRLSAKEVLSNAQTYKKQVFKILNPKKTRVVFNSKWLINLPSEKILDLASHITIAQLLARADFSDRYKNGRDISLLEFFYPLLQAYDSVELRADIELGGIDQKFNLLLARELQKDFGQEPQVVIMTPLLVGLDGVNKMSKSLGNYVSINEPPQEIFGKLMSISDELMIKFYETLTNFDINEVKKMHPLDAKKKLAEFIVSEYYLEAEAIRARECFEKIFQKKELPQNMEEKIIKVESEKEFSLNELLELNLISTLGIASKNEFRRLLSQGAVSINSETVTSLDYKISYAREYLFKIGKKKFIKIKLKV